MRPADCHCHLDYEKFDNDREEVIERCSNQLEFVLNAGLNPESNEETWQMSRNHEIVKPALGLHPTYTEDFDRVEEVVEQVKHFEPPVIGEIGLDHHHVTDEETRKKQETVFRRMLELATDIDRPVVVHTRSAEKKSVEILEEYDVDVMLHSFNGRLELAERAIENGMYVGVSTQVLYSSRVQELASKLPLDRLLLETDSPFLYQGERNEPVNVRESAKKIAELRQVSEEEVVEATTGNARDLFSF
jgi:TatD DNase family protein